MLNILFSELSAIEILIYAVSFLLAITIALSMHEYAHAYVAVKQGDMTPKALGRLTLNPFKHLDPLGFMFLLFFGFGWARPVIINPTKFKNYRLGMFLTSIAGVTVNFIMAFLSAGMLVLVTIYFNNTNNASLFLQVFFTFMTIINIGLGVFNLFPIYPLDGFNILASFLRPISPILIFMRKYGTYILLGLVISGVLSIAMSHIMGGIEAPFIAFWNWVFGV